MDHGSEESQPDLTLPKKRPEESLPEPLPELIETLGPEKAEQILRIAISEHKGPLPTSEEFRRYEETVPGAGLRILDYMDREQAFRHEMARREQSGQIRETLGGQFYGFLIMFFLIGAAVLSMYFHAPAWLSAVFIGATAIGAVKTFIEGRARQDDD